MGLRRSPLVALAGSALALAACSSATPAPQASTTTQAPTTIVLAKNGVVTVGVHSLPTSFNPATPAGANAVTAMVMAEVLPQTFVLNDRNAPQCPESVTGVCEGLLGGADPAELIGTSPQVVLYHIDPRAVWSDGVPITAADFVYNWQSQLAVGDTLPAFDPIGGYRDITSVTGSSDGKTVTVTFARPYADWQDLFTNLIPAHVGKDAAGWISAFSSFDTTNVISGGPFVISRVVPGKELVLVRNRRYWGPPAGVAEIVFKVEASETAMLNALSTRQVDMAEVTPGAAVDAVVSASTSLTESTAPGPVLWQVALNLADPILSNLVTRQAIAEAIDRHEIVADSVGFMTPFSNVAANHLFPYADQGSQPNDSAFAQVNISEADVQLEEAGYSMNGYGNIVTTAGVPLTLTLTGPSGNSLVDRIEAEIQAQLLQAGVRLNIQNVPEPELLKTVLATGDYQLALAPFYLSPFLSTDVQVYSNPVGPSPGDVQPSSPTIAAVNSLPTGASSVGSGIEPAAADAGVVTRDIFGYDDPTVTSQFADAAGELNAGYTSLSNKIDTNIWADLPALPLFQMPVTFVSFVGVLNVSTSQGWVGPLWNAQNWTVQASPPPTTSTTVP